MLRLIIFSFIFSNCEVIFLRLKVFKTCWSSSSSSFFTKLSSKLSLFCFFGLSSFFILIFFGLLVNLEDFSKTFNFCGDSSF